MPVISKNINVIKTSNITRITAAISKTKKRDLIRRFSIDAGSELLALRLVVIAGVQTVRTGPYTRFSTHIAQFLKRFF